MALEMTPREATVRGGDAIGFAVKDGGCVAQAEAWELAGKGTLREGVFTAPRVGLQSVRSVVTARTAAGAVSAEVITSCAHNWIAVLAVYFAAVLGGCVWGVFWLFQLAQANATPEGWLFLLMAALCGAFGSCLHGINSLTAYVGARQFMSSWSMYYLARPVVGGILGPMMFVVFRSNLVANLQQVNTNDWLAVAALTSISGLFADKAVEKLKQVVDVLFSTPKDERPDKLGENAGSEPAAETGGQSSPAAEAESDAPAEEAKQQGASA